LLIEIGFKKTRHVFPSKKLRREIIKKYDKLRDFPGTDGTSKLGVHLRFGTLSIRELVREALKLNLIWLGELIWREFFMMILYNFPHVVNKPFRIEYEMIKWRNNEEEFERWCNGETGYPIVDAGMRELNQTGYMHNRARMITASFLVKHLLIDWRWGETYFAGKLLDYELSSNNGNWQWAAGTGCDSSPYFRIFNPQIQTKKFDPQLTYIRKWVPEFGTSSYPKTIVEHKFARDRALTTFKNAIYNSERNEIRYR
jgi:deoxyribodipyrimidine photo-lyase